MVHSLNPYFCVHVFVVTIWIMWFWCILFEKRFASKKVNCCKTCSNKSVSLIVWELKHLTRVHQHLVKTCIIKYFEHEYSLIFIHFVCHLCERQYLSVFLPVCLSVYLYVCICNVEFNWHCDTFSTIPSLGYRIVIEKLALQPV